MLWADTTYCVDRRPYEIQSSSGGDGYKSSGCVYQTENLR